MATIEVRDAETGEILVLPCSGISQQQLPSLKTSPTKRTTSSSSCSSHPNAVTQSTRKLGDTVAWQRHQLQRIEQSDKRQRNSIEGVRTELRRKDISNIVKRQLEAELMDRMKAQYAEHVQRLVADEVDREIAREVEMRLETSTIGRQRLRKHHDAARVLYSQQIERVRAECEMSLTAAMAQHNFLR